MTQQPEPPMDEPLGERAAAMIAFEATWFQLGEERHDAIRARFACSVEDYNLDRKPLVFAVFGLLAETARL